MNLTSTASTRPSGQARDLARILERRRTRVEQIDTTSEALDRLDEALRAVEALRSSLTDTIANDEVTGRLAALSQDNLMQTIGAEKLAIQQLKARFGRSTINIGVIGRARQGKSKLLQSITGLSRREIPDGSGSHCTGVRSTILHSDSTAPHGEVVFHTEASFVGEVLAPYYADLNLGRPPRSLNEFQTRELPVLGAALASSTAAQAKYEHLERYHSLLPNYQGLIGKPIRRIGLDQVRSYVAQDDEDGRRIFHNYLAVKEVQIYCAFPHQDASDCGVIDMPGLGDTGVGDQERLLSVLGRDI